MTPGDYVCVSIPWLHTSFLSIPLTIPNFVGYGIRLFTWSRYDHSFIYLGDNLIVEAQPSGAIISNIGKYSGYDAIWCLDDLTADQRKAIMLNARKLVGTPYGFLDIFCLALRTLGFRAQWVLKRVLREDRLICSQLVALSAQRAGIDWLCGKNNACLVTPANLARRAEHETN